MRAKLALGASPRTSPAICYNEIRHAARLLTFKAADMMDKVGNKSARSEIAQIKVVAPNMAMHVLDRAIQVHGAAGLSQDLPLAAFYAGMRALRMGDGPDEVHLNAIAKIEFDRQGSS